jgi:dipeptidyl aminopeptidase/acylaminoacyl peptidase
MRDSRCWVSGWIVAVGLLALALAAAPSRAAEEDQGTPAATPPGLLATTAGGAVRLVDPRSGASRVLLDGVTLDRPLAWRPDGRELLVWRHDAGVWELWSVPLDGSEPVCLAPQAWGGSRSGIWSPDGSRLAFWRTDPEGVAVLRPGQEPTTVATHVHRDTPPVWRADGKAFAFERAMPTDQDDVAFACWHAVEGADGAWALKRVGHGRPVGYVRDGAALLVEGLRADRIGAVFEVDLASGTRRCLTPVGVDDNGAHLVATRDRVVAVRRGAAEEQPWHVISHDLDGGDLRDHGEIRDRRADVVSDPGAAWIAWTEKAEGGAHLVVAPLAGGPARRMPAMVGELLAWQP